MKKKQSPHFSIWIKKPLVAFMVAIFFIAVPSFAAITGYGSFGGTTTTAPSGFSNLNQDTPYAIKWSQQRFDSNYFEHSTSSFNHEITIKTAGNYRVSYSIPLVEVSGNNRRAIRAELYVNGSPLDIGRAESSYIRDSNNHTKSSLHFSSMISGLSVDDIIEIRVSKQTDEVAEVTTPGAQIFLQYIDPSDKVILLKGDQTTSGVNLNTNAERGMSWDQVPVTNGAYSHSTVTNNNQITFAESGNYRVTLNIPLQNSSCSNRRTAVQTIVRLNGAIVTSGGGSQGYIRCADDHDSASIHWFGYLHGVTAGQTLTVNVIGETTVFDTNTVPSGKQASLFIEQVDTSTKTVTLTGTTLTTGNNWNPTGGGSIQWNGQVVKDATVYTHSTSSNSHQITFAESGDYLVTYNDFLTANVQRAAPAVQLRLNNSLPDGGECRTHYIRNNSGHVESSCAMSYLLENVSSGDVLEVAIAASAATGTVNDRFPAQITLYQINAQEPILDIASIPNKTIHFDMSNNANVLDGSNRNANDTSFSGSVQKLVDISGVEFPHDGDQPNPANQPTFDKQTKVLNFDGVNDFYEIANATDINTGTTSERTFAMVFRTGADVTSRQMIYEEGGTVRGINVYIASGSLYLGFWNLNNDGDGSQAFTSTNTSVAPNTNYYVTMVYDYSNYTGPSGPNGTLRGTVNGQTFDFTSTTTSRLYNHPGDIGLGALNNGTCYHTGCVGGNGDYFAGDIFEFIMYNSSISPALEIEYYNFFANKWPDPFPVTNLAIDSQFTNDASTSPNITWDASISTDIDHYEVAIGTAPGLEDEAAFSNVGNVTNVAITGLSLTECTSYYATVKAVDPEPKESTLESTPFFRYDGTAPSDPSGLALSGAASASVSQILTWNSSTDNCVFESYEVALGTTSGGNDVVDWTDVGTVTSYQFTGLTLADATDYFISVRAKDSAGNVSNEISSSSFQLDGCVASDVTNPTDPTGLSLSGIAGSNSSPSLNWSASADSCGLSHYEVAIGSSAGASDVQTFTNVGDVLTYKFFSLASALSTNTDYYLTLKAVDLAGNESNVVSSSAWSLPAPGSVSSGLVLWLDGDDLSTLYQSDDCTSTAVSGDGQVVGCWLDKSQSANNATATGNNRPTYQTDEFNGKAIVRFDGSNDALDFTAITDMRTVFVVNKSSGTTYQPFFGRTGNTDWFTNDTSLVSSGASAFLTGGSWRVNKTGVSNPQLTTQTGQYSLYSVVSTGNVSADHIASDRKTGGRFFNGDVVEVIVYDRALSEAEVVSVENYLYDKWFSAAPGELDGLALSSEYTSLSTETPTLSWNHSAATDFSFYEVSLGLTEGLNDVAGWFNNGVSNSYQSIGNVISECVPHYINVRAVDTDGNRGVSAASGPFLYDGTSPTVPASLVLSGSASTSVSEVLTWASATDACTSLTYEVSLGTTSGGTDVVNWTDVGNVNSYQFTGLSISESTDYFINVRAKDAAGNLSGVASSAGWQVASCVASDTTNPLPPSGILRSGSAELKKSPSFNWVTSTDACAFSHHEVSIGTSAGSTDVVTWLNIGSASSYQFENLVSNLSYDTNYYFNVRGVDQAGNNSTILSSSAWTLTAPGSVSAANLAIWVDLSRIQDQYPSDTCTGANISGNNQGIGCIKDLSGNDNHLTVNASANKPVFRANNFNGLRSAYFDGASNEYWEFTTRLTGIRTVFWVLKEDPSNLGDTVPLLGDPNGGTTNFARAATGGAFWNNTTSSASVRSGTLQMNKVAITGTSTTVPTSESVVSLVTTGATIAGSFSRDDLGCCGNRTFGGNLAELIIYERALNAVEVEAVEDYLMTKWSLVNTTTEWLGSVSTDWANAANWSNGVPNSGLDCIIPDRANDPILSGAGACRDLTITNGSLTLQNASGTNLSIYDDFIIQTGSFTANDGMITVADNGSTNTDQDLDFKNSTVNLTFSKSAGGTVNLISSATLDTFTIPVGSNFSLSVNDGVTLDLTNGLSQAGATVVIDEGATLDFANGTSATITGGTFSTAGLNDSLGVSGQDLSRKGTLTSTSGRWSFNASAGIVSMVGFVLNNLDVNGLQINGSADLVNLDGGQFTNLLKDYATPTRALTLNTSTTISESVAVNVGFSWGAANAGYAGDPTPADNYFTVYAPSCGNGSLVFDQWFGDFWGAPAGFDTEDKIFDNAEGGTCSVSMDIATSPVTITDFSATPYNESVLLIWETGSELDHLGFNIYRSTNPVDGFVQINNELIRNYLTSGEERGRYRFVDPDLTNDTVYYYLLEDVAINGDRAQHGPVFALPKGDLGAVPSESDPDTNEPISDPGSINLGSGISLLSQTKGSFRISINPGTLQLSTATWDTNYVHLAIPGYSRFSNVGYPELLERKILVPVDASYSSVTSTLYSISNSDVTASLSGKKVSPAPGYTTNGSGELVPNYSENATAYSNTSFDPAIKYVVNPQTIEVLGKHYVEVTVYPLSYEAFGNNLEKLDQLILDVGLEGSAWDYTPPSDIYEVAPSVAEGTVRIKYSEAGMYKVTYANLLANNMEGPFEGENIDNLRLYYHEQEIPLKVVSVDGVFGPGDELIFYAPFEESLYDTFDEVVLAFYDFDVSDNVSYDARRIDVTPNDGSSFIDIDEKESITVTLDTNNLYVDAIPVGFGNDRLMLGLIRTQNGGGITGLSSYTMNVDMTDLAADEDFVYLTTEVLGRGIFTSNPSHHLQLEVDNVVVDSKIFKAQQPTAVIFKVPASYISNGTNAFKLTVLGDQVKPSEFDWLYIESIEVSFKRGNRRTSNHQMYVGGSAGEKFVTYGHLSSNIEVYDVSDYKTTFEYEDVFVDTFDGGSSYQVSFKNLPGDSGEGGNKKIIVENGNYKTPSSLELSYGVGQILRDSANDFEYIVVADSAVIDPARDLADYRSSQGLNSLAVTMDQVYAEFSNGRKDALAIQKLIKFSEENWATPIRYLFIIGDGSWDPKDDLGWTGYEMPPVAIYTGAQSDYVSDNALGLNNLGNDEEEVAPLVAIGRLPTNNLYAVERYIEKVQNYESGTSAPEIGNSMKNVFIAGDNQDNENLLRNVTELSEAYLALNDEFSAEIIDANTLNQAEAKAAFTQAMDDGPLFLTYQGHGAEDQWGEFGDVIANESEAAALTNSKLPILMALGCSNTNFMDADPTFITIGEQFVLNENGGAIAFFGSSTFTGPQAQTKLATAMINQFGQRSKSGLNNTRLGEVVVSSLQTMGTNIFERDMSMSWILMGDPALRFPETAFSEPEAAPTSASAPEASSDGGGGCSAFAGEREGENKPIDSLFFIFELLLYCGIYRFRKSLFS